MEQTIQQENDSLVISTHNHANPYTKHSLKSLADCMIEKDVDIVTIDGYEMPDVVTRPFEEIKKNISQDSLLKIEYEIGFLDDYALKLTNKVKNKSIYLINSLELGTGDIGTGESFHLELIGYNGNIKHGASLKEAVEEGLDKGAMPVICHPFSNESKAHKFWTNKRYLGEEGQEVLDKYLEIYQGKIALEEFNAFLINFFPLILDMRKANERAENFLENLEKRMNVTKIDGNDSHIKGEKAVFDVATVYSKMAKSDVDTLSGILLRESVKNNFFSGKYTRSEKKYISWLNFFNGYALYKIKGMIKNNKN